MGRKRIKIAHEAPISLFEIVQKHTDYDYCLVHLYVENSEYREKFLNAKANHREIILDTSVFELGTAFDEQKYIEVVKELQPKWFIIPDVLEDMRQTLEKAKEWKSKYGVRIGASSAIGVVQGKTLSELQRCYLDLDTVVDVPKIAISFDYSYYEEADPHPNKYVSWMLGRVGLLGNLNASLINKNKPHHLLGVALPVEGKFLGRYAWIDSVDTSNPVLHGIKGFTYQENIGLYSKESQKLYELIDYKEESSDESNSALNRVLHNMKEFEKYWNFETF